MKRPPGTIFTALGPPYKAGVSAQFGDTLLDTMTP
jgi:hypothetical protein